MKKDINSISAMRDSLTSVQRSIVDCIWDYFFSKSIWMPVRLLHQTVGGKAAADVALEGLNLEHSIVTRSGDQTTGHYQLTLLGTLITTQGQNLLYWLSSYLSAAKEKAIKEPESRGISSAEVAPLIQLSPPETKSLGYLIGLGKLSSGGSITNTGWEYRFPSYIEDLQNDLSGFIEKVAFTLSIKDRALRDESLLSLKIVSPHEDRDWPNARKVFVVHGRNRSAKKAIFEFLRAIGLDPIEWSQATFMSQKSAPYIGETLDAAFTKAQAVLVLITGDDEAKLRNEFIEKGDPIYEKELTIQARPNVLFEAGMAFGSHQDRTVLVEIEKTRPFSDIAGRYILKIDNSTEKRQELAQCLINAGCDVNFTGTGWHKAGDFENCYFQYQTDISQQQAQKTEILKECEDILLVISKKSGDKPNAGQLASYFKMNEERIKYFLDILFEHEMLHRHVAFNRPDTFTLSSSGRKFLFDKNLL